MFASLYRALKILFSLPLAALGLPPHACRFTPSCSSYCHQAVIRFGWFRGSIYCGKRLWRCRPGSPPGHDPLPA